MKNKIYWLIILSVGVLVFLFCLQQVEKIDKIIEEKDVVSQEQDNGFANEYIEPAIIDYLLTQNSFAWQIEEGSRNFCVIENIYPESELFPLYVWANCGEFALKNGEVNELSGVSMPVKIDYPNELSYYDLSKFSHQAPKDGSLYTESIREIFPAEARKRIFDFNSDNLNQKLKAVAFAGLKE